MIHFYIHGQKLTVKQPVIASETLDYLEADFVFSKDWENTEKTAHFKQGSTTYDIILSDNKITKNNHLALNTGEWEVSVHGNRYSDGEVVERVTTTIVTITVEKTGILHGEAFPQLTPSVGEQILAQVRQKLNKPSTDGAENDVLKSDGAGGVFWGQGGGASTWDDIQGKPTTLAGYGIANEVNQKIGEAIEYLEIASNITHYAKYDGAFILGNRSRYHFAYNGYPITDVIQLPNGDPSRVTAICVYEAGSAGTPTAIVVKPLKLAVTVDNDKFIQDIELSSNFSDENFTTARKDKLDSIVFNKPVSAENPLATVNDLTKPVEITDIPISFGSHISKELYDLIIAGTPFTYDGYKVELGGWDESTEYLKLYVFSDDLSQINTDWQGNGYGVLNITAAGMKIFEITYFTLATSGELQKLDNIAFNQPISAQNKGATMADLVSKENLVYIAHVNVVANQQGQLTITFASGYSYQTMKEAYDNGQKLALWIDSFNGANVYCYLTCDAYFTDHFYFTELIKQNSTDVYPYIFTVIIYSDHNSGRVDQAITADNLNAGIVPYSGSTTYSNGTVGKEITELKSDIIEKQDKLTAGTNITIDANNVISAEGGSGGVPLDEDSTVAFALGYDEGGLYIVTEDE